MTAFSAASRITGLGMRLSSIFDCLRGRGAIMFENIKKRDGHVVGFDSSKITAAIRKAGEATGEFDSKEATWLTKRVLIHTCKLGVGPIPDVEEIQDIVEKVLLESQFYKTAKAYILYREQHAQIRAIAIKASVDLVQNYLRNLDWKINENSNMSYSLQGDRKSVV